MWQAFRSAPGAVVEVFVFLAAASAAGYLVVLLAWPIGPWLLARFINRKEVGDE